MTTASDLRDRVAALLIEAREKWVNDGLAHCAGGNAYEAMADAAIRVVIEEASEAITARLRYMNDVAPGRIYAHWSDHAHGREDGLEQAIAILDTLLTPSETP